MINSQFGEVQNIRSYRPFLVSSVAFNNSYAVTSNYIFIEYSKSTSRPICRRINQGRGSCVQISWRVKEVGNHRGCLESRCLLVGNLHMFERYLLIVEYRSESLKMQPKYSVNSS